MSCFVQNPQGRFVSSRSISNCVNVVCLLKVLNVSSRQSKNNQFKPNGLVYPYQKDKPIFNLWLMGGIVLFFKLITQTIP